MKQEEVYKKVADNLGLPKNFVEKVYEGYWRAVREHITSLPLKEDLTDEEFLELQPNINIPSIGKLYVGLDRYKKIKETYKRLQEESKNK